MLANYRVRITEHDYEYTTYIAWVSATSKNQAILQAGALIGQKKVQREFKRTGQAHFFVEGLIEPEILIEKCDLNEYWDHREEVEIEER